MTVLLCPFRKMDLQGHGSPSPCKIWNNLKTASFAGFYCVLRVKAVEGSKNMILLKMAIIVFMRKEIVRFS